MPNMRHTIEVIGAYVISGARIHPYGYFDRLRDNAIYCDTDLVIISHPRAKPRPIAKGEKFGDMQSELKP